MPLSLVGLGLFDERDITVRGLEIVQTADIVYLEAYTSVLLSPTAQLEAFYGKQVRIADRKAVEDDVLCDEIVTAATTQKVAFLVVGDPFCATTHADLVLRALQRNVDVRVVHNASIMSAVAACGLQSYSFGETVSIPFFTEGWRPRSFLDKIIKNRSIGLHSLCLLDIKVKEQTPENLMRCKEIYEPPRYMTVNQAITQLLSLSEPSTDNVQQIDAKTPPGVVRNTLAFGIARLGSEKDQLIISGTLEELEQVDFGPPLHSLVVCGPDLSSVEEQFYKLRHISRLNSAQK